MAKKRKKEEDLYDTFSGLRDVVNKVNIPTTSRKIPNIIEFVESEEYLNMGNDIINPITLFPMQRLILKAFYRGSEGNENLVFSDEDIAYLQKLGLDKSLPNYEDRGDVVGKIKSKNLFREIVLVWGRRSGKDFVCSIIALYEAMRLLEAPGGDPYRKYNLPRGGNPITILTIANSKNQAGIAFREIKSKLLSSKYFKDKFIPDGLGASSVHLLTPLDRIENKEREARGLSKEKGGIVIATGHSNSDSLLGIQSYVLLMDEVASFKQTDGSSSGRRIYEAMLPSLSTFVRKEPVMLPNGKQKLDENGNPEFIKVFDSKVASISSPKGREGVLWEMFRDADTADERLVCRLPTWLVNIKYTQESLRNSVKQISDQAFFTEYGAEFSATAGTTFFVEENIKECWDHTLDFKEHGVPGFGYFVHLDPALNRDNYVVAVVHKEFRINKETSKSEEIVILDHLKVWTPTFDEVLHKTIPIDYNEVDRYIAKLNRSFRINLVTYDAFESLSTGAVLKKLSIPGKLTRFSKKYKMIIYTELERLVNEKRIILPYDDLLSGELGSLQRRSDGSRGFTVCANKDSDYPTDDCVDALAGAVYNCLISAKGRLPLSVLVNMPQSGSPSNRQWMSMQGIPMGSGSGQTVARNIMERNPVRKGPFGF